MTYATFAPDSAPQRSALKRFAEGALLVGFFLFTFVGTGAFSISDVAARADGSSLDRVVVLTLFALALVILVGKWRLVVECLVGNAPAMIIVAFCCLSIVWSKYPELTLRRSLLLFFIMVISLAVALSVRDLRKFHTQLFVALSVVILFNLLLVVVMPGKANSDIGVRGIYSQKNVAGIVGMIVIVLGAAWVISANTGREKLVGVLALMPAVVFLIITRSKTSINLTALGLVILFYFALAERYGPRFILSTALVGVFMLAGALIFLAAIDFDIALVLDTLVGDRSFSGRDELWAFAKKEALKTYWLGNGYGAFWDVGIANDPLAKVEPGSWLASVKTGVINQAHNGYLELALHIGMPMTVLASAMVVFAGISLAGHALFGAGNQQARSMLGALALLVFLHLAHNFTEATLFMRGSLYCTLVLVAMFLASRAKALTKSEPVTYGWQQTFRLA